MTASGQRISAENVAAPEPTGTGQATALQGRLALCALCGGISKNALPIRDVITPSGRGLTQFADPVCIERTGETVLGAA